MFLVGSCGRVFGFLVWLAPLTGKSFWGWEQKNAKNT